jgi:hypothetical protein
MSIYEGEFGVNNIFEGKGVFRGRDGDVYDGEWKNGKRDGQWKEFHSNGSRYEGEWKNGVRDGIGTYFFLMEIDMKVNGRMM